MAKLLLSLGLVQTVFDFRFLCGAGILSLGMATLGWWLCARFATLWYRAFKMGFLNHLCCAAAWGLTSAGLFAFLFLGRARDHALDDLATLGSLCDQAVESAANQSSVAVPFVFTFESSLRRFWEEAERRLGSNFPALARIGAAIAPPARSGTLPVLADHQSRDGESAVGVAAKSLLQWLRDSTLSSFIRWRVVLSASIAVAQVMSFTAAGVAANSRLKLQTQSLCPTTT
ncbi:MAG TPA: hypothetical protein VF607_15385 [Verrucomicrobiae bacterium]